MKRYDLVSEGGGYPCITANRRRLVPFWRSWRPGHSGAERDRFYRRLGYGRVSSGGSRAKIVIRDLGTGVERSAPSNESGFYVVNALPASRYSISVSREGFTTQKIPEFTLQVGQQAAINITLAVSSISEAVTVRPR